MQECCHVPPFIGIGFWSHRRGQLLHLWTRTKIRIHKDMYESRIAKLSGFCIARRRKDAGVEKWHACSVSHPILSGSPSVNTMELCQACYCGKRNWWSIGTMTDISPHPASNIFQMRFTQTTDTVYEATSVPKFLRCGKD